MNNRQKFIAFKTILIKEILRFSRIWIQTLLPPAITTVLYFLIFGSFLGKRIGVMEGVAYIDFMVPGLILMGIITHSYANVVSSFFGAKFQRNIEEMLVSPIPDYLIVLGFVGGGVARGLAVGLVVTFVSMFYTTIGFFNIWVIISMALLTAVLFSLAGLINAVYARKFDDISIVPTFILTPLTYLGGVFYSVDLLSGIWKSLSAYNPILHMVTAFRYGFLGSHANIALSYVICFTFIMVLYVYCLYLMRQAQGMRS